MYGIYTYIYHKNQPNVGKYTSPMDPQGSNKTNLKTSAWLLFQATFQFNGGTNNGQRDMIPSGSSGLYVAKGA